jgi:hypothetical protein
MTPPQQLKRSNEEKEKALFGEYSGFRPVWRNDVPLNALGETENALKNIVKAA